MTHPARDSGFTLLELMVTIAISGILMAIAVGGWTSWAKASAHSGAAREIQSAMRQAQQQAVTEGTATCFWFDAAADTYAVYRGRCTDAGKVLVKGPVEVSPYVDITAPEFTSPSGDVAGTSFLGRGTGSAGDVTIARPGSTKKYVLTVDGLTGRVGIS